MKHVKALTNKTISTMIKRVWVVLEDSARYGAKVIKRRYETADEFVSVTQKNRNHLCIHYQHVTNGTLIVTMVNNQITRLCVRKDGILYLGSDCVGRTTPYFEAIMATMKANSPRGRVAAALHLVGDYLLLNSTSKTGRVKQQLDLGKTRLIAWRTPKGKVTVSATGKHEVYLEVNGDDITVSYGELHYKRKSTTAWGGIKATYLHEEFVDFDDIPSCTKAIKFLQNVYPTAFQEKGIRVS